MLDKQSLPWVRDVIKTVQQPLRSTIAAGNKMLEPIIDRPSAFAKIVRFSQGFQEPAEVDDEYLEMTTFSTC